MTGVLAQSLQSGGGGSEADRIIYQTSASASGADKQGTLTYTPPKGVTIEYIKIYVTDHHSYNTSTLYAEFKDGRARKQLVQAYITSGSGTDANDTKYVYPEYALTSEELAVLSNYSLSYKFEGRSTREGEAICTTILSFVKPTIEWAD